MAKVILSEGIQSLSGTYGFTQFSMRDGQCIAKRLPLPKLPKKPTSKQWNAYHRTLMVLRATAHIQENCEDIQLAIRERRNILYRMQRLYDKMLPVYGINDFLYEYMLMEYYKKYGILGGLTRD